MVRGDGHDRDAPLGSAATLSVPRAGWSSVCNTPFRRHKTWVHEGGISHAVHRPLAEGHRREGRSCGTTRATSSTSCRRFWKWRAASAVEVRGARRLRPGKSLVPVVRRGQLRPPRFVLVAARRQSRDPRGRLEARRRQGRPWELYDLNGDRAESKNLAKSQPEKVQELAKLWDAKLEEFRSDATRATEENRLDRSPQRKQMQPVSPLLACGCDRPDCCQIRKYTFRRYRSYRTTHHNITAVNASKNSPRGRDARQPADEHVRNLPERHDQIPQNIDENRIRAGHHKRKRPAAETEHVDQQIKRREQQVAPAAGPYAPSSSSKCA